MMSVLCRGQQGHSVLGETACFPEGYVSAGHRGDRWECHWGKQ